MNRNRVNRGPAAALAADLLAAPGAGWAQELPVREDGQWIEAFVLSVSLGFDL